MILNPKRLFYSGWIFFSLLLIACTGGDQGQLKPFAFNADPLGPVSGEPMLLQFSELDGNPAALLNRYVRVSGAYTPISNVACKPVKGPQPRWGLVSEGFQMEVVGADQIVAIAPEGVNMTVDGVWRHYYGPLGCGKEPEYGTRWYLEVQRIFEPNPLIFNEGQTAAVTPTEGVVVEGDTSETEPTPENSDNNITTNVPGGTPTAEPTLDRANQTPTNPSPTPLTPATQAATATPIRTPTPVPTAVGSGNATNVPTATPTATPTADGTGTPTAEATQDSGGLVTSTPGTPDAITPPPGGYGGNNGGNNPTPSSPYP